MEEILKKKQYEELLTSYFYDLRERSNKDMLKEFSSLRDFKLETVEQHKIAYVENMEEMLIPKYLEYVDILGVISKTNNKPIFHNRYVIPIFNERRKVENLVGYSKVVGERYVYGTSLYYLRTDTLYGLENLKLAYELGYAIITEGITDCIRLRDLGFKNTFALCGTHHSEYIQSQLERCKYGVIKIPDRDSAGLRATRQWKFNREITLLPNIEYKDIDEMCFESERNKEILVDYLTEIIEILLDNGGTKIRKSYSIL